MILADAPGFAPYLGIFLAAIFEGEVMFVIAAMLVSQGRLDPMWVAIAGAAGGASGDQLYFYMLRGRLRRWLDRFPAIARRGHALVGRVRRNETLTVLAVRFSPGLRIALAAACAYADVPAWKFTAINTVTAVAWSAGMLALIAWAGPKWLPGIGLSGWWSALVPALLLVVMFYGIGRAERKVMLDNGGEHTS